MKAHVAIGAAVLILLVVADLSSASYYSLRKLRRGYTLDFNTTNTSSGNTTSSNATNTSCIHGRIVEQIGCLCNSDTLQGFWEPRGLCDSCAQNYAGANCTIQCPGGSCNPCSSHGVCNQGLLGDGTCRCNADTRLGFWDGADCSDCQPGYYGARCLDPCPGLIVGVGVVCFGNGVCSSGARGSGKCSCSPGWGSASGCADCDASHYGPKCAAVCPGTTPLGQPCSGHGYCFFGLAGNGTCVCAQNFVGESCSLECPFGCFGHGVCVGGYNNTQECHCSSFWAPPYCEFCATNRAGPQCLLVCTQTPFNKVCFNNGTCAEENGVPVCNCSKGYASYQGSCDAKCPGTPPCGGHGTCYANPQTLAAATCSACDAGWAGPLCSECDPWHANSEYCNETCPGVGKPCSGNGSCVRGECICNPGFCGTSCNTTLNCSSCPVGLFGPSCNMSCPTSFGRICGGNGYCTKNGECRCVPGYFGRACNGSCAVGLNGLPCSGITQGICVLGGDRGSSCSCLDGFVGDSCSRQCPTALGLSCRGNGMCRLDGNATTVCDCFPGWTGAVCDVVCLCNSEHGRCAPSCAKNPSYQPCSECVCDARFTGKCNECVAGLQGAQCDGPCVRGKTVGTACVCDAFWSGKACDVECPKNATGDYCSGHGGCTTTGQCLCEPFYFGISCSVHCQVNTTCSRLGKNTQCNPATGACECRQDSALGHWAIGTDGTCDTNCAPGYWGPSCVEICNCNNRGSCSKFSGSCVCFDTDSEGHFAGETCSVCASGYVGELCTQRNVQITRLQAVEGNATVIFTRPYSVVSLAYVDDVYGRLFVGNSPISVVNISSVSPFVITTENDAIASLLPTDALFLLAETSDIFLHLVALINSSASVFTFDRSSLRFLSRTELAQSTSIYAMAAASSAHQTVMVWSAFTGSGPQWRFTVLDALCFNTTNFVGCTRVIVNGSGVLPVPSNFSGDDMKVAALDNETYRIVLCGNESLPNATIWDALVFDLVPRAASPVRVPIGAGNPSVRRLLPCWPALDLAGGGCNVTCRVAVRSVFFQKSIIFAIQTANDTAVAWVRPFDMVGANESVVMLVDGSCQNLRGDGPKANFLCSNCSQEQWSVLVSTMQQKYSVPTAMAVDIQSNVLYVALRSNASLSVLVKLRIDPVRFSLYGQKVLNLVQGSASLIPESFYAMSVAPSTSSLYSVASFVASLTLGVFVTYDVTSVAPSLADIRSGTVVNVSGTGFKEPATCLFNGTVVPATVVSTTLLQCVPPELTGITTADSCNGLPVDVSMFGGQYPSDSGLTLSRVQKPELKYPTPEKDSFHASSVTITGSNFVNSPYGICRFVPQSSSQPTLYGVMTFVNPSVVVCARPTATQSKYAVDVALDGQQFSGSPLTDFLVVGAATRIVASGATKYQASQTTSVNANVITVDTLGNALGVLDTKPLNVSLRLNVSQESCNNADFTDWRFEGDPFPWPPCDNISILGEDNASSTSTFTQVGPPNTGSVSFSNISIVAPRVGVLNLTFISSDYGFTTLTITITEGVPYALRVSNLLQFTDLSAPYAVPKSALLKAVKIFVCDVIGNICSNISSVALSTAQASVQKSTPAGWVYVSNSSADSELNSVNGNKALQFSQMTAPFIHGVSYRTVFTIPGLQSCTTPAFETEQCLPVEYKVPLTPFCNPCPAAGAVCNGSAVVLLLPGYWRAPSSSVNIFPCPIADSCLGDSSSGNGSYCMNGSTGPLCSLCQAGYGKTKTTQCQQCLSVASTVAIFAFAVVVAFVVVVVWSFFTVREETTTNISIVLRTIVNHMQTTGQLGEFSQQFSPFLRSIFNIQGGSSSINMSGFQTLDCLLEYLNRTYISVFVGYMCLPLTAPFVSTVLFVFLRIFNMKPVLSKDLQREIDEEIRVLGTSSRLSTIRDRYPFYFVFTTSVCVIVFTLYQTLIQQAANVLKCVNLGPGQSYLEVDMSISCDDNGTSALTTPGLLFAVGYGFGIPLGFVCAYIFFKGRLGKPALTNFVFMFLVGGYKPKYWYWQAVIMVRKLLLVMVTVFIPKDLLELQNYCAMWVMLVALVLQLWLKPNIQEMHNNVEAFSLATIAITLNFGLVYFWPTVPSGASTFITTFLIVLTLFCVVVFAYYLYDPLREELHKAKSNAGDLISKVLSGKEKSQQEGGKKLRIAMQQRPIRSEQEETALAVPDRTSSARLSFANFSRRRARRQDEITDDDDEDDKPANLERHLRHDGDEYY